MLAAAARRAEVAAPPGFEVRDALTVWVSLTYLLALVEAQAFAGGLLEVDLSGVGVAFSTRPSRNESTRRSYYGRELVEGAWTKTRSQ